MFSRYRQIEQAGSEGVNVGSMRKMRMKMNKTIQLLAFSAARLVSAALMSACASLTVDFVYVTCAKAAGPNNNGEVNVIEINSQSGRKRQNPTNPFFLFCW